MKVQPVIRQQTLRVAAGTLVLCGVMLAVYLLLGALNVPVLLGALLGTACAVLNFFLLGLSVQKAAEEMHGTAAAAPAAEEDDEPQQEGEQPLSPGAKRAKRSMQLSYAGRMLLTAAVAIAGFTLPFLDGLATVIPLLFPRIVIPLAARTASDNKPESEV